MTDRIYLRVEITGTSKEAVLRGLERAADQYRTTDLKIATEGGIENIGNWRYAYSEIQ